LIRSDGWSNECPALLLGACDRMCCLAPNWKSELKSSVVAHNHTDVCNNTIITRINKYSFADFIFSSTAYGRIIISEAFLPDAEKTIKPCNVQLGLAGGTKFIVGNILFKFALDTHGLLGSGEGRFRFVLKCFV
jgi:hypothetical protein